MDSIPSSVCIVMIESGNSKYGTECMGWKSRLTVVSRAAKKLQSARPIKRRAATTVSYLRVGPVSQY